MGAIRILKWVFVCLLLAGLTFVALNTYENYKVQTTPVITPSPRAITINSDEVFNLVNNYRASLNRKEFSKSSLLCEFAETRAHEIVVTNNFSHDGFNNELKKAKYSAFSYISENLSADWFTSKEVVDGWISSDSHREAMERSDLTHACIDKEGDRRFVVLIMGKLR